MFEEILRTGLEGEIPHNHQRLSTPTGAQVLAKSQAPHLLIVDSRIIWEWLREAFLNRTDELCERDLLDELRRLAQFFECITSRSSRVSREQEIETQVALDHVANKNVPRAVRVLQRVIETEPLNLKGHLLLGTIYLKLRSYPKAIKALSKGREVCRQTIKYLFMHADLLDQDRNMQDGRDYVAILHRIADLRYYEGLFLHRVAEGLIRIGAYNQAMRLLATWRADDQPTPGS